MLNSHSHWMQLAGTHGARLIAIVLLALLLIRLLRVGTRRLIEMAKSQSRLAKVREDQTRTMAGVVYSVGVGIILIVALLAALPELGFNITPVAAAAGLASLAVGFGGQHLVKDLINGFFIIFEDQYVVGDWIKVNGETGRVEHMTLRRTVMRTDRGAIVSIPCGIIGQVSNLSRDWGQTYVDVTVSADEASAPAIAVLERVCEDLRNDRGWSAALVDGPRVLGIDSITMDGTTVRIQLRSPALRQDEVARELRRRLKLAFEQAHISLLSTRRVEVTRASPTRNGQENSHNSLDESTLKEEIER